MCDCDDNEKEEDQDDKQDDEHPRLHLVDTSRPSSDTESFPIVGSSNYSSTRSITALLTLRGQGTSPSPDVRLSTSAQLWQDPRRRIYG
jgi:hypothetical protein